MTLAKYDTTYLLNTIIAAAKPLSGGDEPGMVASQLRKISLAEEVKETNLDLFRTVVHFSCSVFHLTSTFMLQLWGWHLAGLFSRLLIWGYSYCLRATLLRAALPRYSR
jgi:hypothetical protein